MLRKKNIFILPNGAAGKNFIRETTRFLNAWNDDRQFILWRQFILYRLSFTTSVYFAQILRNMLTTVTDFHPGYSSSVASNSNHAKGQLKGIDSEWQFMQSFNTIAWNDDRVCCRYQISSIFRWLDSRRKMRNDPNMVGQPCWTWSKHWIQPTASKVMAYCYSSSYSITT